MTSVWSIADSFATSIGARERTPARRHASKRHRSAGVRVAQTAAMASSATHVHRAFYNDAEIPLAGPLLRVVPRVTTDPADITDPMAAARGALLALLLCAPFWFGVSLILF